MERNREESHYDQLGSCTSRKKFKRMRFLRKEGEKEKEESVGGDDGKEDGKRKERRGRIFRQNLVK